MLLVVYPGGSSSWWESRAGPLVSTQRGQTPESSILFAAWPHSRRHTCDGHDHVVESLIKCYYITESSSDSFVCARSQALTLALVFWSHFKMSFFLPNFSPRHHRRAIPELIIRRGTRNTHVSSRCLPGKQWAVGHGQLATNDWTETNEQLHTGLWATIKWGELGAELGLN